MQFCSLEAEVKAPPPSGRGTLAVGDQELHTPSPGGEAAQLMAHMVSKLAHSLCYNALIIVRKDTFDYSLWLL